MTRDEHVLMLSLFTKQTQFIKMLLDMLKSRGIVDQSDLPAFEFSVRLDAASNVALFEQAKEKYLALAKGLGIETGLENLPPALETDFSPKNP